MKGLGVTAAFAFVVLGAAWMLRYYWGGGGGWGHGPHVGSPRLLRRKARVPWRRLVNTRALSPASRC